MPKMRLRPPRTPLAHSVPRLPSWIWGAASRRGWEGEGRKREGNRNDRNGKERRGKEGKGREGKKREGRGGEKRGWQVRAGPMRLRIPGSFYCPSPPVASRSI